MLCLQETKLQPTHVKDHVHLLPGYTSYWTSSVAKKGYAGSVVFVRGEHPEPADLPNGTAHHYEASKEEDDSVPTPNVKAVTFGLGIAKHDQEG